jgi:hypothetical protein
MLRRCEYLMAHEIDRLRGRLAAHQRDGASAALQEPVPDNDVTVGDHTPPACHDLPNRERSALEHEHVGVTSGAHSSLLRQLEDISNIGGRKRENLLEWKMMVRDGRTNCLVMPRGRSRIAVRRW